MGRRRKARELALQSLYEMEFPGKDAGEVLRSQADRRSSSPESEDYATRLVSWVDAGRDALDEAIDAQLENWDPDRVTLVLRNLLRLGLAEARNAPEVPRAVILDEWVELARKFDTEEGLRFVNGVLDKLLEKERPSA